MSDIHFVEDEARGVQPIGTLRTSSGDPVKGSVTLDNSECLVGQRDGSAQFFRVSTPESKYRMSILAPKEVKQLFDCERIEVEVPSIELKFEGGLVQAVDEELGHGYKVLGSRVVKLRAGKYLVNLKRWEPIVKFETEAPAPRWPRIVAALLWLARKAGMQSPTKVDIHCGPIDTHTLQVKYQ